MFIDFKSILNMAPNSIGAFLFNTVRENRNPEPCLSTLSRFSTWRPTGDSIMNQRTSHTKKKKAMVAILKEFSTWRPNEVVANTATQN